MQETIIQFAAEGEVLVFQYEFFDDARVEGPFRALRDLTVEETVGAFRQFAERNYGSASDAEGDPAAELGTDDEKAFVLWLVANGLVEPLPAKRLEIHATMINRQMRVSVEPVADTPALPGPVV